MKPGSMLLVVVALATLTSCGTANTTTTTITRPAPAPSTTPVTTTATATTALTAPTSTTTADVYFQAVTGPGLQRPGTLELTGDGTLYVSGVQWTSWGGPAATGSGIAHSHGCTPNCAQAPVTDSLVAIRLSAIRACAGRQYYSGVTLTLNSGELLDKDFLQRSWSPC